MSFKLVNPGRGGGQWNCFCIQSGVNHLFELREIQIKRDFNENFRWIAI